MISDDIRDSIAITLAIALVVVIGMFSMVAAVNLIYGAKLERDIKRLEAGLPVETESKGGEDE